MRTYTIEKTVYTFDELSADAQQNALEELSDINVGYEWWDSDYDDFKTIADIIGINIKNIYFSGFYSQGDGACFEGEYSYKKDSVKNIQKYAPLDTELHTIAKRLRDTQKSNFYSITATIKHSGHYSHEYCTNINVYINNPASDYEEDADEKIAEEIRDILRDFMRWIYNHLEKQYYFLTSKEAILETIEANEYEFDINGVLD